MALPWQAHATVDAVAAEIAEITGSADLVDDLISIDMPDIAENGNQVNLSFEVDSPMTADDYVNLFMSLLMVILIVMLLYSISHRRWVYIYASTRMRLSKTQNVYVLAAMSDGSFAKAPKQP